MKHLATSGHLDLTNEIQREQEYMYLAHLSFCNANSLSFSARIKHALSAMLALPHGGGMTGLHAFNRGISWEQPSLIRCLMISVRWWQMAGADLTLDTHFFMFLASPSILPIHNAANRIMGEKMLSWSRLAQSHYNPSFFIHSAPGDARSRSRGPFWFGHEHLMKSQRDTITSQSRGINVLRIPSGGTWRQLVCTALIACLSLGRDKPRGHAESRAARWRWLLIT